MLLFLFEFFNEVDGAYIENLIDFTSFDIILNLLFFEIHVLIEKLVFRAMMYSLMLAVLVRTLFGVSRHIFFAVGVQLHVDVAGKDTV